jgi:hypothetical protein
MVCGSARVVLALSLTVPALVGCARMESSPTAPTLTPPAVSTPLMLTIRVHERSQAETPIAGARVVHESTGLYTDAAGESHIIVQPGRETTIDVSADGYRPMQASAVLNSSERWTFFLEPES